MAIHLVPRYGQEILQTVKGTDVFADCCSIVHAEYRTETDALASIRKMKMDIIPRLQQQGRTEQFSKTYSLICKLWNAQQHQCLSCDTPSPRPIVQPLPSDRGVDTLSVEPLSNDIIMHLMQLGAPYPNMLLALALTCKQFAAVKKEFDKIAASSTCSSEKVRSLLAQFGVFLPPFIETPEDGRRIQQTVLFFIRFIRSHFSSKLQDQLDSSTAIAYSPLLLEEFAQLALDRDQALLAHSWMPRDAKLHLRTKEEVHAAGSSALEWFLSRKGRLPRISFSGQCIPPKQKLTSFPSVLLEIENLKELSLPYHHIASIPPIPPSFSCPEVIDLRGNCLSSIPSSFAAARELHCQLNFIRELPETFLVPLERKLRLVHDSDLFLPNDERIEKHGIPKVETEVYRTQFSSRFST